MASSSNFVVLLGSVTSPGRMHRALGEATERANASGTEWSLLDLGTVQIGFADGTPIDQLTDDSAALVAQIEQADGVLLASPVYRASMTGALKNALDLLPVDALRAKPVGILAMGGGHHHFLGVASHLRDVLAWFGAVVAPTDVYLASRDFTEGAPTPEAGAELDELLGTVERMASALGDAELGPAPLAARY